MEEDKKVGEDEEISPEKFREMFEGEEVRLGLVRHPGAIMEQWAALGSVDDIIKWAKYYDDEEVKFPDVIQDLINVLGPGGPMIFVYIVNGEGVLISPSDGKIYPNWE